jgi:hypothetical protein
MDKMPWYKSNVLRGLLVAGLVFIAQKVGIASAFGDADAAKLVDLGLGFVEGVGMAFAAYHRVASPTPPVSDAAVLKTKVLSPGE